MVQLRVLEKYGDDNGNSIEFSGIVTENIRIKFAGSNNRLTVASPTNIARLHVDFDCDNSTIEIGANSTHRSLRATIRAGQDCTVTIGEAVTMTGLCIISAAEGTSITIGDDCMIASNNEIRTEDGHPIFDAITGHRVNTSQSVIVGNHVWMARNAVVLAGVTVGDGSVIAHSAVVTRNLPNNCVAAGVPAKVVRRNIAWERPHLTLAKPYYKPDATTITKSPYWRTTEIQGITIGPWERLKNRLKRFR